MQYNESQAQKTKLNLFFIFISLQFPTGMPAIIATSVLGPVPSIAFIYFSTFLSIALECHVLQSMQYYRNSFSFSIALDLL